MPVLLPIGVMLPTQDDVALGKVRDGNQVVLHDPSVNSVHLHK